MIVKKSIGETRSLAFIEELVFNGVDWDILVSSGLLRNVAIVLLVREIQSAHRIRSTAHPPQRIP